MSGNKHAIVIGANGLVGSEVTKQLLDDDYYEKVTLITRRYIDLEHEKLEVEIVDFKNLHKDWDLFKCDDVYYCLGTTRSDTPRKSDYHKIEFDYCLNIAKISHHNKVNKFIHISSAGANPKSWIYYLKLKGEVENNLMEIGFNYLHIVRPYFLMGKRDNFRYGESIARFFLQIFNFMMVGFLKNIKGMPATLLAKSMIHYAKQTKKGSFIHTNRQIHELFPKK
jgi:uncharacterized protein YbjT (DUF2867 family)